MCCVRLKFGQQFAMERRHIIARAFELAPQCATLKDLARKLDQEGYPSVRAHLKASVVGPVSVRVI